MGDNLVAGHDIVTVTVTEIISINVELCNLHVSEDVGYRITDRIGANSIRQLGLVVKIPAELPTGTPSIHNE